MFLQRHINVESHTNMHDPRTRTTAFSNLALRVRPVGRETNLENFSVLPENVPNWPSTGSGAADCRRQWLSVYRTPNFERTVLFAKLHSNVVVDILYLVRDPRGMENSREQLKKNTEQIWTPQSQEMSLNMNYRGNVCETSFEIGYIFLVYSWNDDSNSCPIIYATLVQDTVSLKYTPNFA